MSLDELRSVLDDALSRGKVYIHVDPSIDGVDLPPPLMQRERVPLVIAWQAPHIDLQLGEQGIAATLRFSGNPYRCVVPWPALLAVISDHPVAQRQQPPLQVMEGGSENNAKVPRERPHLKFVDD